MSAAEIGARLRQSRKQIGLSSTAMAEKVGLSSRSSWERYERGLHMPSGDVLIALAGLGVNANWILTGQGEMLLTDVANVEPANKAALGMAENLTEDLLGRIVEGITMVYREEGGRLAPRNLGQMAARLYSDLVAAYDVPEERVIGLKGELAKLRRELRTVPADTGSSKRLA